MAAPPPDFLRAETALRQALLEPSPEVLAEVAARLYAAATARTSTRIVLAIVVHFPSNKHRPWFLVRPSAYETEHRRCFASYEVAAPPTLLAPKELSSALLAYESGYQHLMQISRWLDTTYKSWFVQATAVRAVPVAPRRNALMRLLAGEPEPRDLTEYTLVYDQALTARKEARHTIDYQMRRLVQARYRQQQQQQRSRSSSEPAAAAAAAAAAALSRSTRGGGGGSSSRAESEHSSGSDSSSSSSSSGGSVVEVVRTVSPSPPAAARAGPATRIVVKRAVSPSVSSSGSASQKHQKKSKK
jgi:hypothetical protein